MDREPSEIEKLTARIEKDPRSKLFVPLAEEYKKLGDREMAIHVLTEGLKHNPGYITAKASLGRLLLEGGDLAGAKKEFEAVVKTIPDNLLAQRKLGDICVLQGDTVNALRHYRSVLALNSADTETASLVADLKAGRSVAERVAGQIHRPQTAETAQAAEHETAHAAPAAAAGQHRGRPAADDAGEEEPEEVLFVEPLADDVPSAAAGAPGRGHEFLIEDAASVAVGVVPEEDRPIAEFGAELPERPAEPALFGAAVEETALPARGAGRASDDLTTNTLAELYITQGFYDKAIDIYQRLLNDNPGNASLQAKLTELRERASRSMMETAETGAPAEPFVAGPVDFGALPSNDETPPFGEPIGREYVPPPAAPAFEDATDEQALFGVAGTPVQASGTVQEDALSGTPWQPAGIPAADESGPFGEGYVPTEYRPQHPMQEASLPSAETPLPGRQETIARLEQWLRNIAKERGR